MDKEMELLLSEKEIEVGEIEVVVKRIPLLDTMRIAAKLSDVLSKVLNNTEGFNLAMYKILYNGNKDNPDETENDKMAIRITGVLELIGLAGDDAIDLLKMVILKSTNLDKENVEKLDPIGGIDLLEAIYEVNKGFFEKCMSKLKVKMEERPNKKKK